MLIRSLPAVAGAIWLRDGWRLFARQPVGLSSMVVVYLLMLFLPALLPFIGIAVSGVLAPFATLALLAACREVDAKRVPTVKVFAEPFQNEAVRVQMLRLGLVNATLVLLIALAGAMLGPSDATQAPQTLQDIPLQTWALQFALYLPVLTLMWFSPALVGWHGATPGKAMFGSIVACWRNKGPMLVYGAVAAVLMMGASAAVVGLLAPLLASQQAMSFLLAPLALVLMTIVQASFYPMYRSIFQSE
jgi:hypothetical protein